MLEARVLSPNYNCYVGKLEKEKPGITLHVVSGRATRLLRRTKTCVHGSCHEGSAQNPPNTHHVRLSLLSLQVIGILCIT